MVSGVSIHAEHYTTTVEGDSVDFNSGVSSVNVFVDCNVQAVPILGGTIPGYVEESDTGGGSWTNLLNLTPFGIGQNFQFATVVRSKRYLRVRYAVDPGYEADVCAVLSAKTLATPPTTGLEWIHSPADVVKWALIGLGEATDSELDQEWPAFSSYEPNDPDNSITTYDTAGVNFGRLQNTGTLQDRPGVTIRIRSRTHAVGYVKSHQVAKALDESIRNTTVTIAAYEDTGAATYLIRNVQRTGSIVAVGADAPNSKRRAFTINTTVTMERVS